MVINDSAPKFAAAIVLPQSGAILLQVPARKSTEGWSGMERDGEEW